MRGRGMTTASFSKNSDGSKHMARVPSRHGRRKRSSTLPSAVSSSASWATGGRKQEARDQGRSTRVAKLPMTSVARALEIGVSTLELDVGVTRAARGHHRYGGITAQPQHPLTGPRPRGDPPEHGGALQLC